MMEVDPIGLRNSVQKQQSQQQELWVNGALTLM